MTKGPQQFEAGRILASTDGAIGKAGAGKMLSINRGGHEARRPPDPQFEKTELLDVVAFLEDFEHELSDALSVFAPDPYVRMTLHLIRSHLEAKTVTPTSLIGASGVPYATATRRIGEMIENGILAAPTWQPSRSRLCRCWPNRCGLPAASASWCTATRPSWSWTTSSASSSRSSAPTFTSAPFPSTGCTRKRCATPSARQAAYDLIAVDLPWIGEFVTKGVLHAAADVHGHRPAGSGRFPHGRLARRPLGRRALWRALRQTTPELLFYRKDWFAKPAWSRRRPRDDVIAAAKSHFHDPRQGRYGVAWNAARGTALGHTFMMTCADFGQPIIDLPRRPAATTADRLKHEDYRRCSTRTGRWRRREYLMELLEYSPPDILSMSWYERVRPYAAGKVAMAYGYTLLAPYFELDETSPAHGNTGYPAASARTPRRTGRAGGRLRAGHPATSPRNA
jgi:multiple sugar transport system substrate-binding protein